MAGKETSVKSEYMLSQGYRDSARQATITFCPKQLVPKILTSRLHLQHWIWKEVAGYVLHPSIPKSAPDWTVADIGTGNA